LEYSHFGAVFAHWRAIVILTGAEKSAIRDAVHCSHSNADYFCGCHPNHLQIRYPGGMQKSLGNDRYECHITLEETP
jgi:hypothetical protein